jgi:hypothetical protein
MAAKNKRLNEPMSYWYLLVNSRGAAAKKQEVTGSPTYKSGYSRRYSDRV